MKVNLLVFAAAREIVGADAIELDLQESATIASLQAELGEQFPDLVPIMKRSTWSVGFEYVTVGHRLQSHDEIGLIPPVSGG